MTRGWARVVFYLLLGPLLAYLAAVLAFSVALLVQGDWAANASLVFVMWLFAIPATPLGWVLGVGLFVPVLLVSAIGARLLPARWLLLLAAAAGAVIYWAVIDRAIGTPRIFDSAQLNDMIRWSSPFGGAIGALSAEWIAQQFGPRAAAAG